jgi:hypothetical protein
LSDGAGMPSARFSGERGEQPRTSRADPRGPGRGVRRGPPMVVAHPPGERLLWVRATPGIYSIRR